MLWELTPTPVTADGTLVVTELKRKGHTYWSYLDHLELDVLRLLETGCRLRHWDILNPLVVPLGRSVIRC